MEYLILLIFIILIDFFTKEKVKQEIPIGEKKEIVKDKFYIWHIKNYGIAYNKFEKHTNIITAVTGIAISIFVVYFFRMIKISQNIYKKLGLTLFLGGAVGNFIDRAKNKSVTDFLYYKKGNAPIFNFADIFIFIGSIIIIIRELLENKWNCISTWKFLIFGL